MVIIIRKLKLIFSNRCLLQKGIVKRYNCTMKYIQGDSKMEKYQEPQIYVINNSAIAEKLREKYIVEEGNLGIVKEIWYEQNENNKYVSLEYDLIGNLHEFKVVIIDLQNRSVGKICKKDEFPDGEPYLYQVDYPTKIFDPSPLVMNIISSKMNHNGIRIIFCDKDYTEKYEMVKIERQNRVSYFKGSQEGIYNTIGVRVSNKTGKKIKPNEYILAQTVAKYVNGYNVIFGLPTVWDPSKQEYVLDRNYIPLIFNQDDEVIAYIEFDESDGYELLLPVCQNKEKLIDELLTQVLPEIFPDIFPESKEFQWINNEEFKPKEVLKYEKKKKELKHEYEKQLEEIQMQEAQIYEKYQFLNDLLIQTGSVLVKAVCKYFEWLGFSNVQEIDGRENIFREDIQAVDGSTLFIMEVKGIGGTSTDAECSQIAKHRRKREKENRDKEIVPIYIVNHQRYKQPQLRENPPFTVDQIDYAYSDERGLLTTWQLYQQFKLIEEGVFTKEETRQAMRQTGLITLLPKDFYSIGTVTEYFKEPKACILNLKEVEIKRDTYVWAKKGETWKKGKICSIQVDDNDVDTARNGEVGVVLDIELAKGFELFCRN